MAIFSSFRNVLSSAIVILAFFFLLVIPAFAQEQSQFSSSYNVSYDVGVDGVTTVTERVTLKNLTDKYYASSFTLTVGSTKVFDVAAFDDGGSLEVKTSEDGLKTQVNVKFLGQVVGKDKEYTFNLTFKSNDFSQKQGKTWQVSVPRVSVAKDIGDYRLTLSVPIEFGDPTSIVPEPNEQTERGDRLQFYYTKEKLSETGILANFGSSQVFSFNLGYEVENPNIFPQVAKLPIPPDTGYQQVIINKITPEPENVILDRDGNYIGFFKVEGRQKLRVKVEGLVKLSLARLGSLEVLTKEEEANLTVNLKYWERDNPDIRLRLEEILNEGRAKTNQEKARLVNKFVVGQLKYDESRLNDKDFQRFGGVTALANPDRSLCSEFSDLFISLARAANVPARQLVGYAYTSNKSLRPLSFNDNILHSWSEYYDPTLGWVMIDPTWENTTGGVDYFSKFDLNHFVLATRGGSSESPVVADEVSVEFSDVDFKLVKDVSLSIKSPEEAFAGLPIKVGVMVENKGNYFLPKQELVFKSSKFLVIGESAFTVPVIPPFGKFEYEFDLRTESVWDSDTETLMLEVGDKTISKKIIIRPLFGHKYFTLAVLGVVCLFLGVYIITVILHLRSKGQA